MDLQERLFQAVNDADAARRAFLRYLQLDNQCKVASVGEPCHSHKCGCAIEMQNYIDDARK